jgi:signal peptide peptidase SppA
LKARILKLGNGGVQLFAALLAVSSLNHHIAPMFKRLFRKLRFRKSPALIHVVRLEGALVAGRSLRGGNLNMLLLEPVLVKAFRKGVAAVALEINSPGGSPVQSALIANRIRALSVEHKVPVYAFCEDVAASGGYWLACAADEIYADDNSIVGSIGVISMGFGFPGTLKKLGVERRVHTSGESKSTNDPFKPEKPEDVAKLKAILNDMHESFRTMVRQRRDGKLKAPDKELFSGAYWTGAKSLELGLIDGLGHMQDTMKRKFGKKAEFRKIEAAQGWGRRFGLANASHLAEQALETIENRAMWQRFGL